MSDYATPSALDAPLDSEEIITLDKVLVKHSTLRAQEAATLNEGKQIGVCNVSDLDGYLTAMVSAPQCILPSIWVPAIWGDFDPSFATTDEFSNFLALVTRHSNTIARVLMEAPARYQPLTRTLAPAAPNTEERVWLTPWCEGYLYAQSVAPESWEAALELLEDTLAPIYEVAWLPDPTDEHFVDQAPYLGPIAAAARQVHALNVGEGADGKARAPYAPPATYRRDPPRVGRNDPCPCGSGKKFKRCCLH
ncbi:MAG: UPF0149 family protein [Pseudomonadota bacterium]